MGCATRFRPNDTQNPHNADFTLESLHLTRGYGLGIAGIETGQVGDLPMPWSWVRGWGMGGVGSHKKVLKHVMSNVVVYV